MQFAAHPSGKQGSFWVLDGHGGDGCANHCAPKLAEQVASGAEGSTVSSDPHITFAFPRVDSDFRAHVRDNPEKDSGSTVTGALISKQDDGTYSAKLINCGDSRGLLVRDPAEEEAGQKAFSVRMPPHLASGWGGAPPAQPWPLIAETVDHKPNFPTEKARIEAAGGFITNEEPSRLDGNLAVSRGLGDFEYKGDPNREPGDQKVSCIPDIYEVSGLRPGSICILACDGLWDVMKGERVASFVRDWLKRDPGVDLAEICTKLIRMSLELNSRDNVTCMIIHMVDGSEWSQKSNRFNNSDEMLHFDKLQQDAHLDEDVRKQYNTFLRKCSFQAIPQVCSISGRWFSSMWLCPTSGKIYSTRSCQKKGWSRYKAQQAELGPGGKEEEEEEAEK